MKNFFLMAITIVYSINGYCGLMERISERKNNYLIDNYEQIKEKTEIKEIDLSENIGIKKDVVYANYSKDNTLDIYYNKKSNLINKPVIFMVHGGAWLIGDKSNNKIIKNKVEFFVNKNDYIFVSINYRMEKNNIHPQEVSDVSKAISWVYRNIRQYGGNNNKIIIMGHSAGAHLISDEKYLNKEQVPEIAIKGVIPLDGGGFDLNYLLKSNNVLDDMGGGLKNKIILERIQGTYNMAWKDYSENELMDASPINHVNRKLPPFLLIESSRNVPHQLLAQKFTNILNQYGTKVERKDYDLKHEEINDFLGLDNELTKNVNDFIRKVVQ